MKTFVLILCTAAAMADPKFYRVGVEYKGLQVKEDLMLDRQYAIVTVEDAEKVGCNNSVNLHDFETGYSAVKLIEQGKCIIYEGKRSYAMLTSKLNEEKHGMKSKVLDELLLQRSEMGLSNDELASLAGERIGIFCKDYEAKWYNVLKGKQRQFHVKRSTEAGSCNFCWKCKSKFV